MSDFTYMNREISWLSFNERVLQEAKNPHTPLFERIKFLAIYSSNLDEFYRVRVASIRSLLRLGGKTSHKIRFDPEQLLKTIARVVGKQQAEFGRIFREDILPALNAMGVRVVTGRALSLEQSAYVHSYFDEHVYAAVKTQYLGVGQGVPFLENNALYLACNLQQRGITVSSAEGVPSHKIMALVRIPTHVCPRFIPLPSDTGEQCFIFLDDVIRHCFGSIFPELDVVESYAIKLTRDAELYIDDEFTGNLLDKIKQGLQWRSAGVPSRFLYDECMPKQTLRFLRRYLDLHKDDAVPGGRYHNFSDFFGFPFPDIEGTTHEPLEVLSPRGLGESTQVFDAIRKEDIILYFPYHGYDPVLRFLQEAADDPDVTRIDITLYRVANHSKVCQALIDAAKHGKKVHAFIEVKARFDEEANFSWAETLANAGVRTYYSTPGIKVHSKLLTVTRKEAGKKKVYAYLSTGNFNEKTARLYTDFGFFTANPDVTAEAVAAFAFVIDRSKAFEPEHLLIAQLNMRKELNRRIDKEIRNAEKGKPAYILLKVNSIEDRKLIDRLYRASNAGVNIDLIVRGICCLVPGVKGQSENIRVRSIVDRFLEHPRVYVFHNGGNERMYVSSADWMTRNISRRIEVGFPIYDSRIRDFIRTILDIQLADTVQARTINKRQSNPYVTPKKNGARIQSQIAIHEFIRSWESGPTPSS